MSDGSRICLVCFVSLLCVLGCSDSRKSRISRDYIQQREEIVAEEISGRLELGKKDDQVTVFFKRIQKNNDEYTITLTFLANESASDVTDSEIKLRILAPVIGFVLCTKEPGTQNVFSGPIPEDLVYYTTATDAVFFQIPKLTINNNHVENTEFLLEKKSLELVTTAQRRKEIMARFVDN
jgi:hypothetical protein